MQPMISEIIQVDEMTQNQLLKYFTKKPLSEKIGVLEIHKKIFHINRQKYKESSNAELSFCALIQAINIVKGNEEMLRKKSFGGLSLEEIEKLSKQQLKSFKAKRKKHTREQVVKYLPLVLGLRNEGISFREISRFLYEKYNLKASYSLIFKIYKEIK